MFSDLPQKRADPDDGTMMLLTDYALIESDETRVMVQSFADSQDLFFVEFSKTFQKLLELGYDPIDLYQV